MRQKFLLFASSIALLLLCGVVALWISSHFLHAYADVRLRSNTLGAQFSSNPGTFKLLLYTFDGPKRWPDGFNGYWAWWGTGVDAAGWSMNVKPNVLQPNTLGFAAQMASETDEALETFNHCVVQSPYWFVATLLALLTLFLDRTRRRRRHRERAGRCANCGYDLRASPARCPECGRPAGNNATAA